MNSLSILPIGYVSQEAIGKLSKDMMATKMFSDVMVLAAEPIPNDALNLKRNQFDASFFMALARKTGGDRVLGVTEVDLYVPHLNFVFGQAEIMGKAAVISIYRLRCAHNKIFYLRMLKEAVHELGHTFGLAHCNNKYCVMHFSNCLEDTDMKKETFCDNCRENMSLE